MKDSSELSVVGHAGQQVIDFASWEAFGLPEKRRAHWKKGRSACELGRVWTRSGAPAVPAELESLLNTHPDLVGLNFRKAYIEHETPLPFGTSGPRSHDLMIQAILEEKLVTICVEAKADETFGGTLVQEVKRAYANSPRTEMPSRLNWLFWLLLRQEAFSDTSLKRIRPEFEDIPYQLLTAFGGTLIEAVRQQADIAILVVHEFQTSLTSACKLVKNDAALSDFLNIFLQAQGSGSTGKAVEGPVAMLARPELTPPFLRKIDFYLCKLITVLS